jgi:mRNA interferase MazF
MVSQGDIIMLNFDPQAGHEQAGYRPALVVSNNFFNAKTNMAIVCPVTNTYNEFPLHIRLDERTKTSGVILCENVKSLDINKRHFRIVETLPQDILQRVIDVICSEIEIL